MSDTSPSSEPWRTAISQSADTQRAVARAKAALASAEKQAKTAEQVAAARYLEAEATGLITPAIRSELYWSRELRPIHIAKALGVNYSDVFKHVEPRTYEQVCPQCGATRTVVAQSLAALDKLMAQRPKPCDACAEKDRVERQAARRRSTKPDNVDCSFLTRLHARRRFGPPSRRPPAG